MMTFRFRSLVLAFAGLTLLTNGCASLNRNNQAANKPFSGTMNVGGKQVAADGKNVSVDGKPLGNIAEDKKNQAMDNLKNSVKLNGQ